MTTEDASETRRRRRLVFGGSLLAGLLLGRALLPIALERGIPWGVERQLGLPAQVGNVDLALLRGALALEDVVIGSRHQVGGAAPPDRARALAHWRRIAANLEWTALLQGRITLDELVVTGPGLRLEREADGSVDPLGPRPAGETPAQTVESAEPAPDARDASEPWPVLVRRFELHEGDFDFVDAAAEESLARVGLEELVLDEVGFDGSHWSLGGFALRGPKLSVKRELILGEPAGASDAPDEPATPADADPGAAPSYEIDRLEIERASLALLTDAGPLDITIGFLATDIAARPGHRFPLQVQLGIEEGNLELDGELGLDPLRYVGGLRWRDLPLPPLSLLQTPELLPWLRSCRAGGDLELDLRIAASAEGPAGLSLRGHTSIHDLAFVDPESEELAIEFDAFEVTTRQGFYPLDGSSAQLEIEQVSLVGPRAHYTNPPRALERLLGLLGADASAESEEAASPAPDGEPEQPPIVARIDRVEIARGRLGYRDLTVSPTVDLAIEELSATAKDVRFPELTAESLRVAGVAPRSAPFHLEGRIAEQTGDVELTLERLGLVPFDPFAAQAGYAIARGESSVRTRLKRRGRRYTLDSDLLLHDLQIESRKGGDFEGRFGVSLDLALALLRDPSGDIELPIPLRWEGSVLDVGLGKLLLGALREALVGAMTTPLKLAGAALAGDGPGDLGLEPLAAGPGRPEILEPGRIDGFARLLAQRSSLRLELVGRAGPPDRDALAETMLAERVRAGQGLPDLEGSSFFARRRIRKALELRADGSDAPLDAEDRTLLQRYIASVEVPGSRFEALARERAEGVRALLVASGGDDERIGLRRPETAADPGVAFALGVASSRSSP